MGNKKSQPIATAEAEEVSASDWNGDYVDCDSVDWGVNESFPDRENARTIRATVFGTGGAGKSCLLTKWFCDQFSVEYDPTIENYFRKQIMVADVAYTLEVLDTAGQEEFVAMQETWISDCNVFLLVFSIEDRDSFGYVKHMERKIRRIKDDTPFACVLCGTKQDRAFWSDFEPLLFAPGMEAEQLLVELVSQRPSEIVVSYLWEPRHVHNAEAVAFARERKLFSYIEASSLTGYNVDKVFRILAHCILLNNYSVYQKRHERSLEKRGSRIDRSSRGLERRSSGLKHAKSAKNLTDTSAGGRASSQGPGERQRVRTGEHPRRTSSVRGGRNKSVIQIRTDPSQRLKHARSKSGGL